jgi:hypothetical protein
MERKTPLKVWYTANDLNMKLFLTFGRMWVFGGVANKSGVWKNLSFPWAMSGEAGDFLRIKEA